MMNLNSNSHNIVEYRSIVIALTAHTPQSTLTPDVRSDIAIAFIGIVHYCGLTILAVLCAHPDSDDGLVFG